MNPSSPLFDLLENGTKDPLGYVEGSLGVSKTGGDMGIEKREREGNVFLMEDAPDIESIRKFISSLSFECPFGGNPECCICHETRKLPVDERFRTIAALSDGQCMQIYQAHLKCFEEKREHIGQDKLG